MRQFLITYSWKPHALGGVETFDGLHQADVAFLDQVTQGQAITGVTAGDVHHEAQVGEHQITGGVQIFVEVQPLGQLTFFVDAEHGHAVHRADIGIQVVTRDRQR